MGSRFFYRLAAALTCMLWSGHLAAQETSDLPSVTSLKCIINCKNTTEPKALDKHTADYPGFPPSDYPMEGTVILQATVTKEGQLKDQEVIRVIGPQIFADKALEATKEWRYEPATRNGVPVDRPYWVVHLQFRFEPASTGASDSVFRISREATALSNEGKHAEAIALLVPVLSKPKLNFYERETVSLQLALSYLHQGDVLTAREYLDEIALIGDTYLSKEMRQTFWRLTIVANIRTGQLLEAEDAFGKLASLQTIAPDDPLNKAMQSVNERIKTDKLLKSMGRITKGPIAPIWQHSLMRHDIAIANVHGKLDHLIMICGEHAIATSYSEKAEWHIPRSWNTCKLSAFGDPGTTFTLLETDD